MSGFKNFIKSASQYLPFIEPPSIIIGNMAQDLDSTISSLVYSYYKSSVDETDKSYYPVINIPQEDLKLRNDIITLFQEHDLDPLDLIYEPDVRGDLVKFSEEESLEVILMDHNNANSYPFINENTNVTEIFDHHFDDGYYLSSCHNRIIETLGSTCSLVGFEIMQKHPDFFSDELLCSELLLTTILIDTINLNPEFGKVTGKDVLVADQLARSIGMEDKSKQKELWERVNLSKFDLDHLEEKDILRADYKQFGSDFGICCCRRRILDESELESFRSQRDLKVLFEFIQLLDENLEFHREVVLYQNSADEEYDFDDIIEFLNLMNTQLVELGRNGNHYVHLEQMNLALARKKVSPFLCEYFSDIC